LDLSVVFPVYNEAGNVEALVDDVTRACDPLGKEYEIVVVDDGSQDGTQDVLRRLKARVPRLRVVMFRRNFGQTAALQAGITHARGEILITMDGDGENDPADIPKLLEALAKGPDMVCGWRQGRWQGSFFTRRLPSEAANRLIAMATNVRLHDYGCQFKAFRREVAAGLKLYGEMHRFVPVLASDLGAETVWLKSDDVVKAMIDFARDKGVSKVIVGRTHQPRWRRWLKGDVPARLVADARDLDVEIVATEQSEKTV